jgi:hypothetical protein
MGAVPVSSSWLGRDHRGPAYSFPLALKSPVNCPFTVRLREVKNFGARVEAIFSARLTMPIGSDSQSADDVHRLLPFPGIARSQGRAWNWLTRGAIFWFRCWCGDRHLLELHQRPLRQAGGTSPNQTTALTRWSALNSVLPAVRNFASAAPAISQSPQPTHRDMQSNASSYSAATSLSSAPP